MSANAPSSPGQDNREPSPPTLPRLLVTAGPTHEPIDAVRYIANRSSGRLGIELATEAARRNWPTTLLLGPTPLECSHTQVRTIRFSSSADLEALLAEHAPVCDCLVMAAAVADYRLKQGAVPEKKKIRRKDEGMTLRLEATADLLAGIAGTRQPGQYLVGFALEPRETMLDSAVAKLNRKKIDLIIANPLETIDSNCIEATIIEADSASSDGATISDTTPGALPKADFAKWLLDRIGPRLASPTQPATGRSGNPPADTTP